MKLIRIVPYLLLFLAIPLTSYAEKDSDRLPLLELQTFAEVFDQIKKNYVNSVEDDKLLQHAIEGMLAGLDPHSSYLSPELFEDLEISTKGEFGGLGIEVTMENGFVKVVAPIDDTPAFEAGIEAGDLIVKLDDTPVKGLSLRDAVKIMRGKVGTKILLTVVRQSVEKPLKITITRNIIQVKSVKSKLYDDHYAYIRISQFQSKTGKDLENHLAKISKRSKGGLKGIIIDLRNNPGGVLGAAVDVADTFLKSGLIVYTEGRIKQSQMRFTASDDSKYGDTPIVVLINAGSASGSEIVAGALQDHKRAIIIGSRSFGKGSVQTVLPLKNKRALKLTTAQYFTPNGRSIQAEGIVPDIALKTLKVETETQKDGDFRYTEADLRGHLDNPKDKPKLISEGEKGKDDKSSKKSDDINSSGLAETDFQLYEALNILKGITILKN